MTIALWIIAVCEVIRVLQNAIQLKKMFSTDVEKLQKQAYEEFIKSLNKTDEEFVRQLLNRFEENNDDTK